MINFDAQGRISQWIDIDNNQMTFNYTGDHLTTVTDAFGRTLSLSYVNNRLDTVTDSTGRGISYGYDASGNLTTYTDPEQKVWGYGYDANHRLRTLTNPLNITTATNTYDLLGRVSTQMTPREDANGTTYNAVYNYFFSGTRNVEQDPEGNLAIYYFDKRGRAAGEEDALGDKTSRRHDGQSHVIQTTGPRNFSTSFTYDGSNNLISTTNARNEQSKKVYDAQFHLTDTYDPLNNHIHYDYYADHHLWKTTTSPESGLTLTTEKSYYANGLLQTLTDARQTPTTAIYGQYGNPVSRRTGAHPKINYTYDVLGRMTRLVDQEGGGH